ncbi:MAG: response regulator [Verrucomicrobiota bacterium]
MSNIQEMIDQKKFESDNERMAFEEGYKLGIEEHGGNPVEIIALIDDDENVIEMMSTNLQARGYQTLTGASGTECLQILKVNRPDIVVLDLGLQDINGEDISEVIQHDPHLGRIGIILISGLITPDEAKDLNRNEMARGKFKRYVSKPFPIDALCGKIREIRVLQRRDGVVPWAPPLPVEIHFERISVSVSKEFGSKKLTEELTLKEKIAEYIAQGYKPEAFRPIIIEVLSSGKIRLEVEGRSERIVLNNQQQHMVRAQAEELFDRYYPNRASAFPNLLNESSNSKVSKNPYKAATSRPQSPSTYKSEQNTNEDADISRTEPLQPAA